MKYYFFCLFLMLYSEPNHSQDKNNGLSLYPILINSWKSSPKGKKRFVMTNHKKEKILDGVLEWDLSKNEWIFYYDTETIYIRQNKITVIKKGQKKETHYQCSGFSKVLAQPIEQWDDIMPFDNEIKMDNTCYTEFKTNKSYLILYFQIKPFKIITITFGENKENYILFFEESI